jgi:hypothetical protein
LKYETIDWLSALINQHYFLITLSVVSVFLLNMRVELFSLKLKSLSLKDNKIVFLFLI